MSIKSIVAPVRGDGKGESVLGLALAIGRKFNAHIDVLHVHAKPEDMIPYGVPLTASFKKTIMDAAANLATQEEERLRKLFDEYCEAKDIDPVPADAETFPVDRLSISWSEQAGKQADVIRRIGRFCDLIVVPRPDSETTLGVNTLNAALFDVRKLTAVAPPQGVTEVGRNIAIAWNGSTEAARAVNWSIPLLMNAESVSILSAPDPDAPDNSVSAVRRYLRLHGVDTQLREFRIGRHNIGEPLLNEAKNVGADMLVMGAFGSIKRRELVLGGVTEYVVEHSDLPLIMAH